MAVLYVNSGTCLIFFYCVSGSCSIGRQLEPRYITCTTGTHQSVGSKEPGDNARDSKVKVLLVHVVHTSGSACNQKMAIFCFL
jgi:hypothetical protein